MTTGSPKRTPETVILFVAGLALTVNESFKTMPNPYLLALFATMMGLHTYLRWFLRNGK